MMYNFYINVLQIYILVVLQTISSLHASAPMSYAYRMQMLQLSTICFMTVDYFVITASLICILIIFIIILKIDPKTVDEVG